MPHSCGVVLRFGNFLIIEKNQGIFVPGPFVSYLFHADTYRISCSINRFIGHVYMIFIYLAPGLKCAYSPDGKKWKKKSRTDQKISTLFSVSGRLGNS